jgi:DNA-directed RNA polymerase specialized sigma subunit
VPKGDAEERLAAFAQEWRRRSEAHDAAGEQLREERNWAIREAHAQGVTQKKIAAILGVSQQFVSRLLRG